jgi:hypothetical protein
VIRSSVGLDGGAGFWARQGGPVRALRAVLPLAGVPATLLAQADEVIE